MSFPQASPNKSGPLSARIIPDDSPSSDPRVLVVPPGPVIPVSSSVGEDTPDQRSRGFEISSTLHLFLRREKLNTSKHLPPQDALENLLLLFGVEITLGPLRQPLDRES